jgi:hypothetical protein
VKEFDKTVLKNVRLECLNIYLSLAILEGKIKESDKMSKILKLINEEINESMFINSQINKKLNEERDQI